MADETWITNRLRTLAESGERVLVRAPTMGLSTAGVVKNATVESTKGGGSEVFWILQTDEGPRISIRASEVTELITQASIKTKAAQLQLLENEARESVRSALIAEWSDLKPCTEAQATRDIDRWSKGR